MRVQMQTKMINLILLGLMLGLSGCQVEEFGQTAAQSHDSVGHTRKYSDLACSRSSLVKPPVDILFLFDNSSSSFFLKSSSRRRILAALRNTIHTAGQRFDFRLMIAPLIGTHKTNNIALAVENQKGMSSVSKRLIVGINDNQLIEKAGGIPSSGGSQEYGFERAINLIKYHRRTGVFRNQAHTLVAIFSNEDANWRQEGPDHQGAGPAKKDFEKNLNAFKALARSLQAEQFRLITVAPHSRCWPGTRVGTRYKKMSRALYFDHVARKGKHPDHNNSYDNFDLCKEDYEGIFTGITKTIVDVLEGHKYNYWPLSDKIQLSIDLASIEVFKHVKDPKDIIIDKEIILIPEKGPNRWELVDGYQTRNTRVLPTKGEPFSGHLIKLNGDAQVTFPDCLRIETSEPRDYFGYFVVLEKPKLDTVVYKKNGKLFPKSTSNGWEYLGLRSNLNTRIQGPKNYAEGLPAVHKTGHAFKLHGEAVYSNGDTVELTYLPAPPSN